MQKHVENDRGVNKQIVVDWPANGSDQPVEQTFVRKEHVTSPTSVCVGGHVFSLFFFFLFLHWNRLVCTCGLSERGSLLTARGSGSQVRK